MKKVVAVMIIILSIFLSYMVYASEPPVEENNATVNLKFVAITNEDSMTIQISTGEFEVVEANSVISASMSLSYDENNIIKVDGEGLNNWKVTVSNETKRVLLETDTANPNTEIAKITFYFNQEVAEEISGDISIQEINISDGDIYEETYPEFTQSYTITIPEQETQEPEDNNQSNEIPEINTNSELATGTENPKEQGQTQNGTSNEDNTVAPEKMPQTGIGTGLVIAIILIIVIAVVSFIRYKSIEIK